MAHPHVIVSAKSSFVMDASGAITGIRHSWTFDEAYSAYATTGFKKEPDGTFQRKELDDLAKINIESLNDFKYFTILKQGRKELELIDPAPGYRLDFNGKALVLDFLLPLKTPTPADTGISLKVDDETFFVAFGFAENDPVTIEGGNGKCRIDMKAPKKKFESSDVSKLTEDMFSNLKSGFTDDFATVVRLNCQK